MFLISGTSPVPKTWKRAPAAVSYTHLDVYKRQRQDNRQAFLRAASCSQSHKAASAHLRRHIPKMGPRLPFQKSRSSTYEDNVSAPFHLREYRRSKRGRPRSAPLRSASASRWRIQMCIRDRHIFKLYTDRLPTYREVSDYEVRNDGERSQAVNMLDSIIELLKGGYRVA